MGWATKSNKRECSCSSTNEYRASYRLDDQNNFHKQKSGEPTEPNLSDPRRNLAQQSRAFEVELSNGQKRVIEVEGLKPHQGLEDIDFDHQAIEELNRQKPDEPYKIKVGEKEEINRVQQEEQRQRLKY